MAKITAANLESPENEAPKPPRVRATWSFNVAAAVVPLFLILLGQFSVSASDPTIRLAAVLVALVIVFIAGTRFGRAEQARELLLHGPA